MLAIQVNVYVIFDSKTLRRQENFVCSYLLHFGVT